MDQKPAAAKTGSLIYETTEMLDRYLLSYWGAADDIWDPGFKERLEKPAAEDFSLKCVKLVVQYSTSFDRALDIGCCAGRTSFELARYFTEVFGNDYSQVFIEAANRLKNGEKLSYRRKDCGTDGAELSACVDPEIDRSRVRFETADGSALPMNLKDFDAVLLANVLCRLPNPRACLERMQGDNGLVKPGGILVMTTPFTWLEDYTPKNLWIEDLSEIKEILSSFELLHQEDIPQLLREHRRKFDFIIPLATVWRRVI